MAYLKSFLIWEANVYLEEIGSPADLRKLSFGELLGLTNEIREAILNRVSKIGGHVGPNLGIVEATVALHYVFNSPVDKIVFDVSHQSYAHKILTGRKAAFLDDSQFKTVTGYSEPRESVHDHFTIGHTSTSISLACGLAKGRDLLGGKENIIAVIGDGSLSGGEAYEGLNCGAKLGSNLIVLLNDNEQSISDVNGGLYDHLTELRKSNGTSANNIFKAFGYEYFYLEQGNDLEALIGLFSAVKNVNHPVVVHIHTRKGRGYAPAENNREDWHWFPPFYLESGEKRRKVTGENYDTLVADYLLKKMPDNPGLIAMVAAVPLTIDFKKANRLKAGRQFIDVDISEQHLLSMAAGIARNGGTPLVATFSTFFQRAYDQISQDICINSLPVTMLVRNGSVWAGNDVTHIGWFDLALLSNIPNLVFLCPTNCEEYFAMLEWSLGQREHPVAIRIPRNGVHHASGPVACDYSVLNRFLITQKGTKVAILALGDFYQMGEDLASAIKAEFEFEPTLINPRFATGLDTDLLLSLAEHHDVVVTLEDGILDGGFGQKVASFYGTSKMKVLNYGLRKEFVDGYNAKDLLEKYGLTSKSIIADIARLGLLR